MTKPAIPTIFKSDEDLNRFAASVKQTLDSMTGQARNVDKLQPLRPSASLTEVIERVNQIISRLQ